MTQIVAFWRRLSLRGKFFHRSVTVEQQTTLSIDGARSVTVKLIAWAPSLRKYGFAKGPFGACHADSRRIGCSPLCRLFYPHYWFRARHSRYPQATCCGSGSPRTPSKRRPIALGIDACDRTRVTTTRRLSCDLAFFTGTNHTSRATGTATIKIGSGMTFLAIAVVGDSGRLDRELFSPVCFVTDDF